MLIFNNQINKYPYSYKLIEYRVIINQKNTDQQERSTDTHLFAIIEAITKRLTHLAKGKVVIYLSLKRISQTLLIMSSLILSACSTSPLSITMNPTLSAITSNSPAIGKRNWQLSSQDFRTAHYLILVTEGEGAATLINDAQNSRLIIEQALRKKWTEYGLKLNAQSKHKMTIQLIKLQAKVKQTSFTHTINSTVTINVRLESGNTIFNKIFTSNNKEEAPFSVNIKKTGAKLNTQLSLLLDEIINDQVLNNKLK